MLQNRILAETLNTAAAKIRAGVASDPAASQTYRNGAGIVVWELRHKYEITPAMEAKFYRLCGFTR